MNFLVILTIAFAPGIFWVWLISRWDKFHPEPRSLIIRTFILGLAVAVPVAVIEVFLYPEFNGTAQGPMSLMLAAYLSFIVAGFPEELGKFLVVRLSMYRSQHFDEPIDGLVYSSTAALGFASIENFVYLLSLGWEVILLRGFVSTLAHVFFSALWGYPLALYKTGRIKSRALIWVGLLASMIAHGVFNFLLFAQNNYTFLVILFFIGLGIMFFWALQHANKISHYR